jgi:transcriptional regulator with XRE-family HTH domain
MIMEKTIDRVLAAIRSIALSEGLSHVTRRRVADNVGVTETQISRLAASIDDPEVKHDVGISKLVSVAILKAIRDRDDELVARGLQAEFWRAVEAKRAPQIRAKYPAQSDERLGSALSPVFLAADRLVAENGFPKVTREMIATAAHVSPATVSNAFGKMDHMPDVLMRWAINRQDVKMLARGLQIDNPVARDAPIGLQKQAAQYLIGP